LDTVYARLKQLIVKAQIHYQGPADTKHSTLSDIKIGDQVFILARNIWTTRPSKKLSERYLEPFIVTGKPGSHSYQIQLPEHMRFIHPVFHVSQLEVVPLNTIPDRINSLPPSVEVDSEIEYEIAQILDSKMDHRRRPPLMYYIQ